MSWLLEFVTLWISSGIIILITSWYAANKISSRWPTWWRQHIVDDDPSFSRY